MLLSVIWVICTHLYLWFAVYILAYKIIMLLSMFSPEVGIRSTQNTSPRNWTEYFEQLGEILDTLEENSKSIYV